MDKRQKTHHDARDRGSEALVDNCPEDAVAFLNLGNGPFSAIGDEGALPTSVNVETPGNVSMCAVPDEERTDVRDSSGALQPTGDTSPDVCGLDESIDKGVQCPQSTDNVGETLNVENCMNSEGLSNRNVPPNSQETNSSKPRFDDIIDSLTKLLSECKDKQTYVEALSSKLPIVKVLPRTETEGAAAAHPHGIAGFCTQSRFPPLEGKGCDLRPVCEIRPFMDLSRMVEEQGPRGGTANRRTRRPAGRSRSSGSRTRSTRRSSRRRANDSPVEDTPDATVPDVPIEADDGEVPGPSREVPLNERFIEGRRGPSLAEDGLEIINEALTVPLLDEETAAAAASLLSLELFES